MPAPTIFTRFLAALGVPHTRDYSDGQFGSMTFKSLYGLSHLLTVYGVPNKGLKIEAKDELAKLSPPFLAQTKGGIFVIVEAIDPAADSIEYDSLGEKEKADLDSFKKAWNGVVLLAFPDAASREPDYASHRLTEIVSSASRYLLWLAAIFLFGWFFVTRYLWD
ncbi:MAG: hypothetical protein K2H64_01680, partial [Desulfovibrio sp.]|nr:hypothetical protein [Desulfovibrio sp.]